MSANGFRKRARVRRRNGWTYRTWAHWTAPVAVEHSAAQYEGLPDVWRVLERGDIASKHRTRRAAFRAAEKRARKWERIEGSV